MNDHFATAMGRALEQTRAGNPAEATRLIQAALNGRTENAPSGLAGSDFTALKPRRPLGQVINALAKGKSFQGYGIAHRHAAPAIPAGAAFETHRVECR